MYNYRTGNRQLTKGECMFLLLFLCLAYSLIFLFDFRQMKRHPKRKTALYFLIAGVAVILMIYCIFSGANIFM